MQASDIVDGDFTLAATSRRNRNFKVYQSGYPGLFVKPVPMAHPEVIGTLRQEAAFLRFAKENACLATVRGFVPELRDYNPIRHTLTTTLVPRCQQCCPRVVGTISRTFRKPRAPITY
ncbi:hypothetical protein [Azospirillum soli]|uniref:hypothetical protein n=1 Tax=Azospirillum soli TaxID=1304799 RepID=UPI001AE3BFD1|nr:hypothetical protein [Azospirillum soli]MBP2314948.1 hypothetical protein [Azospirillum soli]